MKDLLPAARGEVPCDLVFRNVSYLNVFSGKFESGDVGVYQGKIVALDAGLKARREVQGRGKFLVPGWIDAHVHIESSMMIPKHFDQMVLSRGTTAAICDPHEFANVVGVRGIQYFLEAAEQSYSDLRIMLSSCVPATHLETNGGGTLRARDLLPLKSHSKALGLAEMMNFPGVIHGDSEVWEKIEAFQDSRVDGHAPQLRGLDLSAYACAGISSCHESSELVEAQEKLRKGLAVWIREGSVAKDLDRLIPILDERSALSLGFCTDDRNPLDIHEEGHLDYLIRTAIRKGVAPEVALRAASWSVARHYGLDRGPGRQGALAPGYSANLVLLDDLESVSIGGVWTNGMPVDELDFSRTVRVDDSNSIRSEQLSESDLRAPTGSVRVIGVIPGKILTDALVCDSSEVGVHQLSVKERYGKGLPPQNGYVKGFGERFRGAIASSVGHDSHNLISVGSSPSDMAVAMNALIECGGGFVVVRDGAILERLALPLGGLMSKADPASLVTQLRKLKVASRSIGCELSEPFLQLAFLSLPVIPSLKLTDRGLVDVNRFEIVSVGV